MNQAQLQKLLEAQIKAGVVYSIVVGLESESINFAAAAGTADPGDDLPMSVDTPYLLASITKMYTAAVILKLHESSLLDLDEVIAKYLPASLIDGLHVHKDTDYSRQIKVHQLVDHTSGLADYFDDQAKGGRNLFDDLKQGQDRALDLGQMAEIVRGMAPKFAPGAKAYYSDTNYQLLGAIIESVTGKAIVDNFKELIFAPLGLQNTYLYDLDTTSFHQQPAAVYFKDRVLHFPQFLSWSGPDGGVVSTVTESLAFLRAFFEGQLFGADYLDRMTQRWNAITFPLQYGYGLMRFKLPRIFSPFRPTPEFIGHSGATGSFAFYLPGKSLYLAGTINQVDSPGRPFRLMTQFANALE